MGEDNWRMGEPLSSIITKDDTSPIAIHFRDGHGASTTGLQCMIICKLELSNRRGDCDKTLLQEEAKWIFLLGSLFPKGLNSDRSLQCSLQLMFFLITSVSLPEMNYQIINFCILFYATLSLLV